MSLFKKSTLLLSLFLIFSSFSFSQTNLLTNGSLENWSGSPEAPVEWGILNAPTYSKTTDANEGSFAIKIPLTQQAGPYKATFETIGNNNIQLQANKTYTFSIDYKVVSTATVQAITAYVLRDGNIQVDVGSQNPPEDGSWHTLTFDFTTSFATEHSVDIELTANGAGAEILLDNIKLEGEAVNPDRDALVALYNATGGPNWTNTWDLNADMSTWYGVTLNSNNRVSILDLYENNLSGSIPIEIGNLSNLRDLDLERNILTGSIPASVGQLTELRKAKLNSNQLSGTIPKEFGNLIFLEHLWLQNNNLTGNIPPELGNLTSLRWLFLFENQLEGTIPSTLGNMTSLETLSLDNNNLTGQIPADLGNLPNIEVIQLYNNLLDGVIPLQLGNLANLRALELQNNNLSGAVPVFISSIALGIKLENNEFVFDNLENSIANSSNSVTFTLQPQKKLGDEINITKDVGQEVTFNVSGLSSSNNAYQWRKNEINIDGETNSSLTIPSIIFSDSGVYDCVITNNIVLDLVIYTNTVTLNINENDSDDDDVHDQNDNCPNTPAGETVDANGCSQGQLDDDDDGVTNNNDNCPNTAAGETVNAEGCADNQDSSPDINNEDIQVKVTSTSCPDNENGEITVSFEKDYNYTVRITAELLDNTFDNVNSASGLVRSDLTPDTYSVCITIPDFPSFEQCFTVVVDTPEDFESGKTVVDPAKKQGTLVVSGSKNYIVLVNKRELNYTFDHTGRHELSFELRDGANTVVAKTDKICQGEYSEMVMLNGASVFPNPATDFVMVIGLKNDQNAMISVLNMSGTLIKSYSQNITNSSVKISVADFPEGMYLLQIKSNSQNVQTKVVKK